MDLSLLPDDPQRFFELDDGYDRKALKRAYGKAIRVYKPETHPTEFRLIRDAFESLQAELKFVSRMQKFDAAAEQWTPAGDGPGAKRVGKTRRDSQDDRHGNRHGEPDADSSHPVAAGGPSRSRSIDDLSIAELALIDPAKAMRRFEALTIRRPIDYYIAAVLADVVRPAGDNDSGYVQHLMAGLEAYPGEPGLESLVTEYFKNEIGDDRVARVLVATSGQIRSADYYRITQPLWIRAADGLPFEAFEKLLGKCDRSIRQTDPIARAMFTLKLMDVLAWTAPVQWIATTIAEIEKDVPPDSYFVDHQLDWLRSVAKVRGDKLSTTDPVRKELLTICRLIYRDDPAARLAAHQRIAAIGLQGDALRDSFPISRADEDQPWIMMFLFSVAHLDVDDQPEPSDDQRLARLAMLHMDLQKDFSRWRWGSEKPKLLYWVLPAIFCMVFCPLVIVWVLFWVAKTMFGAGDGRFVLAIISGMISATVGCLKIGYPLLLRDRYQNATKLVHQKSYSQFWRKRLFRFVRTSHQNPSQIANDISSIPNVFVHPIMAEFLQVFAGRDVGLAIYALLRRTM